MIHDNDFILVEPEKETDEPKNDNFFAQLKQVKENNREDVLDPKMFDYVIGDKTSLRFEHIKAIKNEHTRIAEMTVLLQETYKFNFPTEFYEWIARDLLNLKYKKWEIDEMKRQYRIKKKRELKKAEEERKRKNGNKKNKKKKPQKMAVHKAYDNPFILNF